MNEAPIKDTGALGGWAEQPDHQDSLNFIVKGEPGSERLKKPVLQTGDANDSPV